MRKSSLLLRIGSIVLFSLIFFHAGAQDKIYTNRGEVIKAKVKEVSPTQIKYIAFDNPEGPLYITYTSRIDSIVYANGKVDIITGQGQKRSFQPRNLSENIPQLNTWVYDPMGFAFYSVSQSYERRLKNGKIGFRVPLYVSFFGGGIAGVGTFKPSLGVYYPINVYYDRVNRNGSSIATGLNLKCYLFKRRVVRLFAGPEATIGYTSIGAEVYDPTLNYYYTNTNYNLISYGTVALLGKFGLSLNPVDKFNITIDGGAGIGDVFGHQKTNPSPVGLTGLWHIGLALGTNF